jgi:hypothetical protein
LTVLRFRKSALILKGKKQMSRTTPKKEEVYAFNLLSQLKLIESIPIEKVQWDKPDIQIDDTGIEIVKMPFSDMYKKDAFANEYLFGKKYSSIEARKVVEEKCSEKYKADFLEKNGSHYISPNLPIVSTTSGGGFNLQPRLEKLREILLKKNEKWTSYMQFKDRRCFVFCGDGFFGIDDLEPIKNVFNEIFDPNSFSKLYLFGDFHNLKNAKGICTIVELTANSNGNIIDLVHNVSANILQTCAGD